MPLYKYEDLTSGDSRVVMKNTLLDSSDLDGMDLDGTGAMNERGFHNGTSSGALRFETPKIINMQVSFDIDTQHICEFDDHPTQIPSGSEGVDRDGVIGIGYIMHIETTGTNNGYRIMMFGSASDRGILYARDDLSGEGLGSVALHTAGKGTKTRLTFSQDATTWQLYADGIEILSGVRDTTQIGDDWRIRIGGDTNGNSPMGENIYYTNLLIVNESVSFTEDTTKSISIFGDSFASQMLGDAGAGTIFDCNASNQIKRAVFQRLGIHIGVDGDGHSGHTICDTSSDNLNDDIDTFISNHTHKNVAIVAGINDAVIATDSEVTNSTTGTYARLLSWLNYLNSDGRDECIVYTPPTLSGSTTQDTAANEVRRQIVINEMIRAVNDFNASINSMTAIAVSGYQITQGGITDNVNFKGYWDNEGNASQASSGSKTDFHPSAYGQEAYAQSIFNQFFTGSDDSGNTTPKETNLQRKFIREIVEES